LLQVEIEIETADKGGTFLGSVVLHGPKPVNLGIALARQGLAKTQPFFSAERVKGGQELLAAIQAAKEARLKVRPVQLGGLPWGLAPDSRSNCYLCHSQTSESHPVCSCHPF
jgi:hypothetical protein